MSDVFQLHCGDQPLLISLPHDGIEIPPAIAQRMQPWALQVADTDWHVGHFYRPLAQALGASLITPRWSRYVVDLNRPADGKPLYPGRAETGLLPLVGFDGRALYLAGAEPDATEQAQRVRQYWQPYHDALAAELARLRQRYARVLLWEGHSIRSVCPMFFEGRLNDFNLGTADGHSASDQLLAAVSKHLANHSRFSSTINGRFKGGYITRNYGNPAGGVHAIQMEMTQASYMDEHPPYAWNAHRAAPAQAVVGELLSAALDWIGREPA